MLIPGNGVRNVGSNVSLLHTSRQRIEIQGLVNSRQFRFRTRGFADMQGAAISALEGGSDALLHGQDLPQTAPAALDIVLLQLPANDLHELVSQDGDEQVAVNANFFMVVDRPQAEFGSFDYAQDRFETAEYGFQVGEHDISAPQALAVPVSLVAAQAVDAGVSEPGPGLRLLGPAQADRFFAGRVREQFDVVMLTDTLAFFLEPADALVEFVETFLGARFAEAVGDVLESGLEAFAEPSIDTLF